EAQVYQGEGRISQATSVDGSWNSAGTYVVLFAENQLWIVDASTGEKQQLTIIAQTYLSPRWSPDEKKIVYTRIEPKQVRMMEIEK
ncbi:MAG: hypothetical protein Q7R83_02340, partial [bacterium]|nr:hypothetical protein [bacterium]